MKMRLIKEDDVMKIIDEELKLRCGYDSDIALLSVKKQIAKLPTAFNVERVVAKIDEALCEFGDGNNCASCVFREMCDNGHEGCVETMVDVCRHIVRKGGVE